MKNKVIYIHNLISVICLAVAFVLLSVVGAVSSTTVYAAESPEVLQDLRKDKDFDESAYPYVKDDYSLKVIQIAESANKELFIYAYQPCHDTYDLVGTKVSISYGYSVDGSGLTPKLYNLRLLSTSGTLDKYHVDGFTVPNDGDRYYNIVEIFRMVNTEIDEVDPAFPKTDKAFSVGQQWYACDLNDGKHYEMNTFNTFPCEKIFDGNMLLNSGFSWGDIFIGIESKKCDVWFYCFDSPEYVIKHIYDATMGYSIEDAYLYAPAGDGEYKYSNQQPGQNIKITDKDVIYYNGGGLLSGTYEIKKILPSSEFIKQVENQDLKFNDDVRKKVLSSEWTFCYLTTEYTEDRVYGYYDIKRKHVYDVGMLQIHFMDTNHKIYDLGVVDDLSTPDMINDVTNKDPGDKFKEFWEMFVKVIFSILFVILLVLLLNFVTPILSILKYIFKGIAFVISAPFKLLKSIFKKDG